MLLGRLQPVQIFKLIIRHALAACWLVKELHRPAANFNTSGGALVHAKVAMCVADVERAGQSRERGVPSSTYVHILTTVLLYNQSFPFCNKRYWRSWKRYHACHGACGFGECGGFTFLHQWDKLLETHGPMYIEHANIMGSWVVYLATPVLQQTTLYYHVRHIT